MKNIKKIILNQDSYLLYFPSKETNAKSLVIVPNSAGYFAKSPNYDDAGPRIDRFCEDLSKLYQVYYLVLPGQDPKLPGEYGYRQSVATTMKAIHYLAREKQCTFVGFIGMCTGAAIVVQALAETHLAGLPLVIYNAAHKVSWNKIKGQKAFMEKYGTTKYNGEKGIGPVTLDLDELTKNAPRFLTSTIEKHKGKIFQLISGKSDYSIELQRMVQIKGMESKTFMTMSDAPIAESDEYSEFLHTITNFFNV